MVIAFKEDGLIDSSFLRMYIMILHVLRIAHMDLFYVYSADFDTTPQN